MSEQTLRHQGLDLLRLLSVVMVIGIHTAGGLLCGRVFAARALAGCSVVCALGGGRAALCDAEWRLYAVA